MPTSTSNPPACDPFDEIPSKARHLSPAHREALRELCDNVRLSEIVNCIAGIVRHDISDYALAESAGDMISRAGAMIGRAAGN